MCLQAFVNIGSSIKLIPPTGMTLPFMENNKYLTTPEGKAIYPYLTHTDTEFKSEGLYHTKLECDQKDCQNLIKKIDDIVAQQVKLQHDQSPKKPIKKAPLPY